MASEVISHAIFAFSHLTSPRTASSSTPPPTPRFAPPPTLRSTPPLTLPFALPPTRHSTLHPTLRSPAPTQHPIMPFTLRPDPIPILIPQPSLFFLPSSSPSLQVTPTSSRPPIFHSRLSISPCSSAKFRLWIFSCVKRPGSLTA